MANRRDSRQVAAIWIKPTTFMWLVWANKDGVQSGGGRFVRGIGHTSVYRFAHHDNDYVIAIVAATQRPKRKDEGWALKTEKKRYWYGYKGLTPCIVVLVERYIRDWHQWDRLPNNAWDRIVLGSYRVGTFGSRASSQHRKRLASVFVRNCEQRIMERGFAFHLKVLKSRDHSQSELSNGAAAWL